MTLFGGQTDLFSYAACSSQGPAVREVRYVGRMRRKWGQRRRPGSTEAAPQGRAVNEENGDRGGEGAVADKAVTDPRTPIFRPPRTPHEWLRLAALYIAGVLGYAALTTYGPGSPAKSFASGVGRGMLGLALWWVVVATLEWWMASRP